MNLRAEQDTKLLSKAFSDVPEVRLILALPLGAGVRCSDSRGCSSRLDRSGMGGDLKRKGREKLEKR